MAKWVSACPDCGAIHAQEHSLGCPRVSIPYGGYAVAPTTEGRKDDGGKARHDLIPPELPEAIAAVLTFGASKYGERNWEKGMAWGRPFAAMMRHMWAWWRGEACDPETWKVPPVARRMLSGIFNSVRTAQDWHRRQALMTRMSAPDMMARPLP